MSSIRLLDIEPANRSTFTVPTLFDFVLDQGGQIPSFCLELEQIVLMGQRALSAVTSPYVTPRDYIFRFFYGDNCYIDSEYEMAVGNRKGMLYDISISSNVINNELLSCFLVSDIIKGPHSFCSYEVVQFFGTAERTDCYIRRVRWFQELISIGLIHIPSGSHRTGLCVHIERRRDFILYFLVYFSFEM